MKKEKTEYVPYGHEWKRAMMKLPKYHLIELIRNLLIENNKK